MSDTPAFFALEALILERLKAASLPGVRKVGTAADIAAVAEAQQTTPAVYLIYGGYRPTQMREGSGGRVQELEQTWVAVVAVRNVRDMAGTAAREDAGPIINAVLASLQGWKPTADFRELHLSDPPPPEFTEGFGYYPLAFQTRFVSKTDP